MELPPPRELHPSILANLLTADCKRKERIVDSFSPEEQAAISHMSWSLRQSYTPPRSAGKEASLLTRRRHSKLSPDRQESSRFCPRVFGQNRHFSQKSALYWPQIRALLWAYRGPRAPDAGKSNKCATYMSWSLRQSYTPPRSAGTELCSHQLRCPFHILSESSGCRQVTDAGRIRPSYMQA